MWVGDGRQEINKWWPNLLPYFFLISVMDHAVQNNSIPKTSLL